MIGIPLALALAACGLQSGATGTPLVSDQTRVSVDPGEAVALGDVVAAADVMGLDLIVGAGDVNTVTSPASLQVALSMAAEGAEGQTLTEVEALIGAAGPDRSDAINALTGTPCRPSTATPVWCKTRSCPRPRWCTVPTASSSMTP